VPDKQIRGILPLHVLVVRSSVVPEGQNGLISHASVVVLSVPEIHDAGPPRGSHWSVLGFHV